MKNIILTIAALLAIVSCTQAPDKITELNERAKKEYNMNVIKNKGVSYGIQDKRMA